MKQLVLASQSPRRKMLLEQIRIPFTVMASDWDETVEEKTEPEEYAVGLSEKKAAFVCDLLKDESRSNSVVLAADTIVVLDRHILGKPKSLQEAFQMLAMLSGSWHDVITGVTLIDASNGKQRSHAERTRVKVRPLSDDLIKRYINTGEPFDKAGAYGIQGIGAILVERLEGCYFNVVGLPLFTVSVMLAEMGFEIMNRN